MRDEITEYDVFIVARPARGAEPRRLYASCIGIFGLLSGLFPAFPRSELALVLAAGAACTGLLALVGDYFDGRSLLLGVVRLLFWGSLMFAGGFLPVWFGCYYLPTHPELYARLFPAPSFPPSPK